MILVPAEKGVHAGATFAEDNAIVHGHAAWGNNKFMQAVKKSKEKNVSDFLNDVEHCPRAKKPETSSSTSARRRCRNKKKHPRERRKKTEAAKQKQAQKPKQGAGFFVAGDRNVVKGKDKRTCLPDAAMNCLMALPMARWERNAVIEEVMPRDGSDPTIEDLLASQIVKDTLQFVNCDSLTSATPSRTRNASSSQPRQAPSSSFRQSSSQMT